MADSTGRRLLKELRRLSLVGVTGSGAALGLAASVAIGRLFGPDGRGDYAVAIVTMMAIGQVLSWGLGEGLAIHASRGHWPAWPRGAVTVTWAAYGLTAAAVSLILPDHALVAAGSVTCAMLLQLTSYALTMGHIRLWAAGQLVQPTLVSAVCGASWAGVPISIDTVTLAYVVAPVLLALPAVQIVGSGKNLRQGRVRLSSILRSGTQRTLSINITALVRRVDVLVLGVTVPAAQVGQYAVAVSLLDLCLMAPVILAGLVLRDELRGKSVRLRHVVLVSVGWILPPLTMVVALGYWVIPLVWGGGFGDVYLYFLALAPGILAIGVIRNVQAWRAGRSEQPLVVRTTLAWAAPAAAVIAVAAGLGGPVGAALAVSVCHTALAAALVLGRPRSRGSRRT